MTIKGYVLDFNRSRVKEMACWAKDPTLVHGMFYAFIFQDALRFRITGEDVMFDLAEAIETVDRLNLKHGYVPIKIY